MEIRSGIDDYLRIRYVKLHFTLVIMEDGQLPRSKVSALRGGMGHALLAANCIRDENCDSCDFTEDCLVQRMMYPRMEIRPEFMTTKDSEGFVIECEDSREWFRAGDELKFNLLLFGRTIVYFGQYLQAFHYFGMLGIGGKHVRFQIAEVTNTTGETLVEGTSVYKERYKVMFVSDYVRYRLRSADIRKVVSGRLGLAGRRPADVPAGLPEAVPADTPVTGLEDTSLDERENVGGRCRVVFQSPLTLKFKGEVQKDFQPEALFAAIERRIYILNCYEGNGECSQGGNALAEGHIPDRADGRAWLQKVPRYSGTQNSKMTLGGIRGWCDLEGVDETALELLLAGELVHIGKNTSFGFGRYTVVER